MDSQILITVAVLGGINGLLALFLVIAERFLANYGDCEITINDDKELHVRGGASLLSTLSSQKIYLPSACGGRGTCAYCKCRVTDGAGPLLPTELPMLSPDEMKQDVRLACQVKVKQDLKLIIPEELFNIKAFRADVEHIEDLTYDIKLLKLKLIDPQVFHFTPGQYVQLQNASYEGVKEQVSRAYSIASSNEQTDMIELMVRLIPEGLVTTWVHQYLKVGDEVRFTGPMGDFRLHDGEGEIVMVAGGSGMAPMASLLGKMEMDQPQRKATYFFGAVTGKDLFYMDEMKSAERKLPRFRFAPALSAPTEEDAWNGETGLITQPLETYLKTVDTTDVQGYLCGSPGMIKACINVFNQHGVTSERIFYDPFA